MNFRVRTKNGDKPELIVGAGAELLAYLVQCFGVDAVADWQRRQVRRLLVNVYRN